MLEKQHEGVSTQKTSTYLDYVGMFHLGQNCNLQSNFSKFGIINPTILQNLLLLNKLHHHLYGRRRAYLYHLLNLVPTTGLHFSPSPKTSHERTSPCRKSLQQETGRRQQSNRNAGNFYLPIMGKMGQMGIPGGPEEQWPLLEKRSLNSKCSHNTLYHTQENEISLQSRENKENCHW